MNYSEMSDEELRLLTAKRLGWTEIELEEWWEEGYGFGDFTRDYTGIPPCGKDGHERERVPLPDWTWRTEAAWQLFFSFTGEVHFKRNVRFDPLEAHWVVWEDDEFKFHEVHGSAYQNPARTITIAWHTWMDQREQRASYSGADRTDAGAGD